jgi:hypothetical protein
MRGPRKQRSRVAEWVSTSNELLSLYFIQYRVTIYLNVEVRDSAVVFAKRLLIECLVSLFLSRVELVLTV